MSHMLTILGHDYHLSGSEVALNVVDIYDIAHHLAIENRYTGATKRPYCVNEHQLLCADLALVDGKSALIQWLCLHHDSHEAYTGDASSPAKHAVGLAWGAFETPHAAYVRRALGLSTGFQSYAKLVHHYDMVALATERRDLTTFDASRNKPWSAVDAPGSEVPPAPWINLNSSDRFSRRWSEWRDLFLERHFALAAQVQAAAAALTATSHPPV